MFERYTDMLYRLCYSILLQREDAEDAVQDVFLSYYRKQPVFADEDHEKAWFIRVAVNRCRDMLRRKNRADGNIEDFVFLAAEQKEPNGLREAIMALPDTYKTAVYLYYYEGYSTKEIAGLLGKPNETVKTWLKRARAQLKEQLGDDYER